MGGCGRELSSPAMTGSATLRRGEPPQQTLGALEHGQRLVVHDGRQPWVRQQVALPVFGQVIAAEDFQAAVFGEFQCHDVT